MKRYKKVDKKKKTCAVQESTLDLDKNALDTEDTLNKKVLQTSKTARGRRYLDSLKPQLFEKAKTCLFLRGTSCSQLTRNVLCDLAMVRKPYSLFLTRKQEHFNLLADQEPVIYLCEKNNCALFCYGSSTKQHPSRLIFGRIFEDRLLDMYECDIHNYVSLNSFNKLQPVYGTKPLVLAVGAEFESCENFKTFRNFLIDFFATGSPDKVLIDRVDQVIALIATPAVNPSDLRVVVRRYRLTQSTTPSCDLNVSLDEVGPSFVMTLCSTLSPDKDMWKKSTKQPKLSKPPKKKNVSTSVFGETLGRVHVGIQDLKTLNTRHYHGKRRKIVTDD